MVDSGVVRDELAVDWDNLLDVIDFDFGDLPSVDGLSTSPDSGSSFSIEHYLLNDDPAEKDGFAHGSGQGPNDDSLLSGSDSERIKESPAGPEFVTVSKEKEREKPDKNVADVMQTRENCAFDDGDNADHDVDDPNVKKRKRQMRNRDAAGRSRERKRMYVRDLEMKSKYYEAECKRLGILLQCCLAENQALRFSLHNSQAFDASKTKQESAVLLLEFLLLGSLLGFLGIICLLILPSQLLSTLEASLLEHVDGKSVAPRKAGTKNLRSLFHSFMIGKRYKASRSRIKLGLFSTGVSSGGFIVQLFVSLCLLDDHQSVPFSCQIT